MTTPTNVQSPPKGFPASVGSTPVPNPLLAEMLEEIDDLAELKLTLRLVWALHRKRGLPKWTTAQELCADRTVARILGVVRSELEHVAGAKLDRMVARGTLLKTGAGGDTRFYLNTAENRRELVRRGALAEPAGSGPAPEAWSAPGPSETDASAFAVYEDNIGPLTPVATSRLEEALRDYPEEAVVSAIQAAVDANARNWNYISAVLKNYKPEEGGQRGKSGRGPEAARSDEFIRKYVERQRARGRR
jgi:DNA replication protein